VDTIALATQTLAYASAFWSMWLCGKKRLLGPYVGIASTGFWVAMAVQSHLWSMIFFEAIYLYLEGRMAVLWTSEALARKGFEKGGG